MKISVISSNNELVEKIAADYPMLDFLRYKGEDFYRFANPNAVKWNAIKAVADFYNISTDTFVAFGDDKNDLSMFNKYKNSFLIDHKDNKDLQKEVLYVLKKFKDLKKYIKED